MALHTYDDATFRALFPAFANTTTYPESVCAMFYANGTNYINANDNFCGGLNGGTLDLALYQMTAHLLQTNNIINAGQTPGIVTDSSIDKIHVSLLPPPAKTAWQFWLATTPYGMQLWALLHVKSVGGWAVGGLPERSAFRKVGGIF